MRRCLSTCRALSELTPKPRVPLEVRRTSLHPRSRKHTKQNPRKGSDSTRRVPGLRCKLLTQFSPVQGPPAAPGDLCSQMPLPGSESTWGHLTGPGGHSVSTSSSRGSGHFSACFCSSPPPQSSGTSASLTHQPALAHDQLWA